MSGLNTPSLKTKSIESDSTFSDTGFTTQFTAQWDRVSALLRGEIGDAAYKSWIKPLSLINYKNQVLEIGVPTRFMKDWVQKHYTDRIIALWDQNACALSSIRLDIVSPSLAPAQDEDKPAANENQNFTVAADTTNAFSSAGSELDPRFKFENFIVGKPNELAYAAARKIVESDTVSFNPLFLYGGVGLGKTHLMHAIAWELREKRPEKKVMYLSAEKFMYQFIRALRFKDTMAFKEQFRSVDVLMIDDVQFIGGKESTQEEFFHTFNALVDQNRQIILSADKSPSDLDGMEDRLKSRLGWGLVADIHPTTYELRLGILQSKKERLNVNVPDAVLEFLAHKISSNIRELEGALNRLVAHAELIGRPLTIETTQDVLADLLRANDRHITIDEIQRKTAEHFNIRMADMHSARRARPVARPRQVAMYLAKQLTDRSLPEIGRKFGGRDHTTVMHGIRKIEELIQTDRTLAGDVDLLRRALQG